MGRRTTNKQACTFLDPSVAVNSNVAVDPTVAVDASLAVEPSFALDIRDVVFRVDELDAVGTVD